MSFESFKELFAFGVGRKLFGGNATQNEADRLRNERQHREVLEAVKANTRAVREAGHSMDWIAVAGDIATVGVTHFAQSELGDIVFIQLPAIGANLEAGEPAASVETINEPRDILAPLDIPADELSPLFDSWTKELQANNRVEGLNLFGDPSWTFK